MKKEDNKDIHILHLQMEIVRLSNEKSSQAKYVRFLEEENRMIEEETRRECSQEITFLKDEVTTFQKAEAKANVRADKAESECLRLKKILKEQTDQIVSLDHEVKSLAGAKEVAEIATQASVDYKSIIRLIQRRQFNHNSDATRFLNGEINPNDPYFNEMGFEDVIKTVMAETAGSDQIVLSKTENPARDKAVKRRLPVRTKEEQRTETIQRAAKRGIYTASVLKRMGIDTSNLPENARLIRRKDKEDGEDIWYVQRFTYTDAQVTCTEYKIGRFNVPGSDPMSSQYPESVIKGNPVMPSFARFYFDSKFALNLSENRILDMLKTMRTDLPQSSLNYWMHQIMEKLRLSLEPLMLAAVKHSFFTHNDETRILVRSRENVDMPFKYNTEYIHAALSLEQKLVVMLYKDGSRGHEVQEAKIFKDSCIKYFLADRAKIYETIEKNLAEYRIERASCWFHARHYLVDAFIVDNRMEPIIQLINSLFYIERESAKRHHTPDQRYQFRLKWSQPILTRILTRLESIKLAGNEYGQLVHRAVNYILEDKVAFLKFLQDGRIEMHNNAIERMFRHIAIGRRNWLHTGSHFAAENIAFMYSLLESCKLNNINYGEYIEDVLTRIMKGEEADPSFLPNHYLPRPALKEKEVA